MAGKRLNLVIIANTLSTFGGGERWVLEASSRLKEYFNITILNPISDRDVVRFSREKLSKMYDLKNINIIELESKSINAKFIGTGKFMAMLPSREAIRKIDDAIKESDIIYAVSFNPFILFMCNRLSRRYKKKLIVGMHNPDFIKEVPIEAGIAQRASIASMNILQKFLIRYIAYIHAQTETQVKNLKNEGYRGKVFYIPHFLYFDPEKPKKKTGDRFTVLFVGRFTLWQKGLDLLEKIIKKTLSKDRSIKFTLVGSGEGENIVRNLVSAYKNNVEWKGFIKEDELKRLYANSSLFILPSRYETPGLGLLEAQSYGIPAVAFDVPGPKDIMKYDFQGMMVKPFDVENFAEEIVKFHKMWRRNKNEYYSIRKEIYKSIGRRYSEKSFVNSLSKMFREVAND